MNTLRAMVMGAGYAGQGHAEALRDCGVEIVAMASRTPEVVREVCGRMGIPIASTDWPATLAEVKPDIVAIGTPGGTHVEMIGAALEQGCHVYADKPLATTAEDARQLYVAAHLAGMKTAYAASFRYQPAALLAKELVAAGRIGTVREVECVSHYNWPRLMPFGWPHRLETGGGRLNNNFTHKLAIVLNVLGGRVQAVAGETRNDLRRVPVGALLHDFRQFTQSALSEAEAAAAEWREVDSDWSYSVQARIVTGSHGGADLPTDFVSATFRHSALYPARHPDYIALYGDEGVIDIDGSYAQGDLHVRALTGEWETVPIPAHVTEALPPIENDTQRNWTQLAREFVADIRGVGDASYLTFYDGWIFQEIIDAVRRGEGWYTVPGAE